MLCYAIKHCGVQVAVAVFELSSCDEMVENRETD